MQHSDILATCCIGNGVVYLNGVALVLVKLPTVHAITMFPSGIRYRPTFDWYIDLYLLASFHCDVFDSAQDNGWFFCHTKLTTLVHSVGCEKDSRVLCIK